MLKNFLETKQGKKMFALAILMILVITAAVITILNSDNSNNHTQNQPEDELVVEEERLQTSRGAVYAGKWYSSREDNMIVELLADGSFRASSWLTEGSYTLEDTQQIVLQDESVGEILFNLETRLGRTIMHTIFEEEDIYLFPTQELKTTVLEERERQESAVDELIYQKWLDVLTQGQWKNQTSSGDYTIKFNEGSFVQEKIITQDNPEVHEEKFTIISQEIDEDSCLFVLAIYGEESREVQFRIVETELTYELVASPGTFFWTNQFETLINTIELTQNGTQRGEAERIPLDEIEESNQDITTKEE